MQGVGEPEQVLMMVAELGYTKLKNLTGFSE